MILAPVIEPVASPIPHPLADSGGVWTPLSIGPSLEYFLRADLDKVTSDEDSFVSSAVDQSGHGRTASQGAGVSQPYLLELFAGIFGFAFDGAQWFQVTGALGMPADNWTVCGVYQTDNTAANQCYLTVGGAAAGYALTNDSTSKQALRSGGVGVVTDGASNTTMHRVVVTRVSGTLHMYVDGVEVTLSSSTASINPPSGTTLVGALTTGLWFLVGVLAELVCVSRVLTGGAGVGVTAGGEIAKYNAYALARYNL